MESNAAILFESYAFHTSGKRLMGAQSASDGFLRAFLGTSGVDRFYCVTDSADEFKRFQQRVADWAPKPAAPAEQISPQNLHDVGKPGCLYQPQPALAENAWNRRQFGETAYSLCGVTHTTCSAAAMDTFGTYLLAPLNAWDAVICTSKSVRATVDHVLENWSEFLRERWGTKPTAQLQLPIIPLGVDCDLFDRHAENASLRESIRNGMAIGPDEVVFLFVGRLSFHAKAHPLPMYLALERAAQQTGKRLHLIQTGWFPNDSVKQEFVDGARRFCPSVRTVFLDGRKPETREQIWFAADVFTSLSDNIQETFGLVPIEAMAAGLPQVISDWNGYRDTVRDDIDGFRIRTIMPAGGLGDDIAWRYASGIDSYDRYIAHASQCTAVDWEECAAAYIKLIESPELRRKMGGSGRQRAREIFHWPAIIQQYQQLWSELAERRQSAAASSARPALPNPLREEPFALFAEYATLPLTAETILDQSPGAGPALLDDVYSSRLANYVGTPFLLANLEECRAVFAKMKGGPQTVAELIERVEPERRRIMQRTLGWFLKTGLARIVVDAPPSE